MRWTTPPFARSNSLRDASGKTSMTFWEQVVVNPRFWLSAGAHVSVAAVLSLLALWAALDARDRLARALVAWVAVMLLVALIIGTVCKNRSRSSRRVGNGPSSADCN